MGAEDGLFFVWFYVSVEGGRAQTGRGTVPVCLILFLPSHCGGDAADSPGWKGNR